MHCIRVARVDVGRATERAIATGPPSARNELETSSASDGERLTRLSASDGERLTRPGNAQEQACSKPPPSMLLRGFRRGGERVRVPSLTVMYVRPDRIRKSNAGLAGLVLKSDKKFLEFCGLMANNDVRDARNLPTESAMSSPPSRPAPTAAALAIAIHPTTGQTDPRHSTETVSADRTRDVDGLPAAAPHTWPRWACSCMCGCLRAAGLGSSPMSHPPVCDQGFTISPTTAECGPVSDIATCIGSSNTERGAPRGQPAHSQLPGLAAGGWGPARPGRRRCTQARGGILARLPIDVHRQDGRL
jgi:hypothetical protein